MRSQKKRKKSTTKNAAMRVASEVAVEVVVVSAVAVVAAEASAEVAAVLVVTDAPDVRKKMMMSITAVAMRPQSNRFQRLPAQLTKRRT